MQAFIRYELDVNSPVNLRRLSPVMKIYAGIITRIHETKLYQTRLHKSIEAEHASQIRKDEMLKDYLLAIMYRELTENRTLGASGCECAEIVLSISSEYRKSLQRVLMHRDFVNYTISEIPENTDFRKAFHEMPILIKVSKRMI